jgi:hypothetical protein
MSIDVFRTGYTEMNPTWSLRHSLTDEELCPLFARNSDRFNDALRIPPPRPSSCEAEENPLQSANQPFIFPI